MSREVDKVIRDGLVREIEAHEEVAATGFFASLALGATGTALSLASYASASIHNYPSPEFARMIGENPEFSGLTRLGIAGGLGLVGLGVWYFLSMRRHDNIADDLTDRLPPAYW